MKKVLLLLTLLISILPCKKNQNLELEQNEKDIKLIKKAKHFDKLDQIDSAYYYFNKLQKIQIKRKDTIAAAKTDINLLVLEYKMHDFSACEYRCVKSLQYSLPNRDYPKTATAYNNLGLCAMVQNRVEESLDFYEKYRSNFQRFIKTDTIIYFITYNNNIGNVYAKMRNYKTASQYFNLILNVDSIKQKSPLDYARALDNYVFYKSKIKNSNINPQQFFEALQIRIDNNEISGITISYRHLAEYYLDKNDFEKVRQYAQTGLTLCKSIHDTYDEPEFLNLLAKSDPQNATQYFNRYRIVTDSLLNVERTYRDNSARIRFQTQEKELRLIQQQKTIRKRNIWIAIGVLSFIVLLPVTYLINKTKKKIKRKNIEIAQNNKEITIQKDLLQQANIQLNYQQEILQENNEVLSQQKSLIEKLKHDIHHRVFNDLKKVQILIGMENRNKTNEFLNELDARITAMLLVHGQLLVKNIDGKVDMNRYLNDLTLSRLQLYSDKNKMINYEIITDVKIDSHQAILIGLIISEFLTNTFKYAFINTMSGEISIKFTFNPEQRKYQLNYSDDGKGFTKSEKNEIRKSMGMSLIEGFTEQLEGTLEQLKVDRGVHYHITF